jgi:hypothetical protein
MATPKDGYWIDGVRVPGTTTIIGKFKESGGLIHWAWKIPFDGLMEARSLLERSQDQDGPLFEAEEFLKKPISEWDYKTKRDKAHEMVDTFVRDKPFDASSYPKETIDKAMPAFNAFLTWARQAKFQIAETEVPLVSRQFRFGGTRDAILIDGKRALGDWKTSNAVYPDNIIQLGAYGILDEENGGTIEGGYHLLRFSKQEKPDDPVHFTHHYWDQVDKGKQAFLLLRQLYDLMADLKRFAK